MHMRTLISHMYLSLSGNLFLNQVYAFRIFQVLQYNSCPTSFEGRDVASHNKTLPQSWSWGSVQNKLRDATIFVQRHIHNSLSQHFIQVNKTLLTAGLTIQFNIAAILTQLQLRRRSHIGPITLCIEVQIQCINSADEQKKILS